MNEAPPKLKYVQLAQYLRELIESGELQVGDRLPTYVELYRRFGATTATVQRVCNLLEQEQLIERRSGSGVYVAPPRRPKTHHIGLIASAAHQAPKTPFHTRLMGALATAAADSQQQLLYLGTEDAWDTDAASRVDGILVIGAENPAATFKKLPPGIAVVSLLNILDNVNSVGIDEYQAGRMAVNHLLDAGHRRIACLMEQFPLECRRRVAGISDALLERGITTEANWFRLTEKVYSPNHSWNTDQPYREWACREMEEWLSSDWAAAGCSALIVQNEVAAIGAIQTIQATGMKVPDQVSIITFDGTELCDLISPPISAVALPLEQIGIKAIEMLNQQIQGEEKHWQSTILPIQLRQGQSVFVLT